MNQLVTLYLPDRFLPLLRLRGSDDFQLSADDFVEMLYPKETNRKQHELALRFLTELFKNNELSNREARRLVDSPSDKVLLMGHILPKMRKLGLIETDTLESPKKYNIRYSTEFMDIFGNLGVQWVLVPRKIKKEEEKKVTTDK
jgi:hypothetical protein